MSTVPEARVHRSDTPKYTLRHTELRGRALGREFHSAGTVDTVCWNGGHGVLERWTRCAGTVDTPGRCRRV
ncbi:hypothetical protein [Kibdelosporangium philippinense]|uniref:hypothetical protein n=1 Tax=Kibdelosporangium philippinense TaxID=211113 RepID=UPI00360A141A